MTQKSTDELLNILNCINSISDLETFTNTVANNHTVTFSQYINDLLLSYGLSAAQLIEDAQIQRNYGYQILNGTKNPGRNKVLSLCLALSLSLSETQRALTLAHENILYPKNKRDSVIIFCLNKHMSVLDTNELLYGMGLDFIE